tara:strand:- start:198 stop:452 length:255 start_codon:yes stop_codon:yes gene_type:complete
MKGLFMGYESSTSGNRIYIKLSAYSFEGGDFIDCSDADDYVAEVDSKMIVILCHCGSNDWTDDGRFMNEYQCNGCAGFLIAHES